MQKLVLELEVEGGEGLGTEHDGPISAAELDFIELVAAKCQVGDFKVTEDGEPIEYKTLVDGRKWRYGLDRKKEDAS